MQIHPNAFKHGLTAEQVEHAYNTGSATARVRTRDEHAEPTRWATIGVDQVGREIELVFVRLDDGVLIIHANKCTNGFRKELQA